MNFSEMEPKIRRLSERRKQRTASTLQWGGHGRGTEALNRRREHAIPGRINRATPAETSLLGMAEGKQPPLCCWRPLVTPFEARDHRQKAAF